PPPRQATPPRPTEQSPPRLGVTPFAPIAPSLPMGARLFYCSGGSCDFQLTNNIDIDPKAPTATQSFSWDVTRIAAAGAVRWQVSSRPFPAFSAALADLEPPGLVASGGGPGQQGSFVVDFKKVAGSAPPLPANFHVRVLPLARPDATVAAGQPSNIIRVHYGASSPSQSSSPFIGQNVTAYNLELVRFEYRPYQIIERWPPGC